MKFLIASIFLVLVSNASSIAFFGTKTISYALKNPKISYILYAKSYIIDTDAIRRKYNFFNRKGIARKYRYRQDGRFESKNIKLKFQKAYKYNGGFIFEKALFLSTQNARETIKAKECFYRFSKLTCRGVKYYKNNQLIKTRLNEIFAVTMI